MMSDDFQTAWHRDLGNTEHRVTITMAGYGTDPDDGERFLEGFLAKCPECGPVVSQEAAADTISATFSVNASDQDRAFDLAKVAWVAGGSASGLDPNDVIRVEIEAVKVESDTSELLPA